MPSTPSRRVRYTSQLPVQHRDALEALLFFNQNQKPYRDVIVDSIERFGEPRVRIDRGYLRLHTRKLGEVQALYGVDEGADAPRPVAVAIYTRTDEARITVLHMAVDSSFSASGPFADEMVSLRLIREVVAAVSRIRGIREVEMLYGAGKANRTTIRTPRRRG